jgi:hypothetical protein
MAFERSSPQVAADLDAFELGKAGLGDHLQRLPRNRREEVR